MTTKGKTIEGGVGGGVKEKGRPGRPSSYTPEKAQAICDALAQGELITHICSKPNMPDYVTLRKWMRERQEFSDDIARAKREQMEYYEDKIQILNNQMNAKNWQYVNAQIRNVQWLMGKLNARYGDKVKQEVSGPEGKPIEASITVQFVKPSNGTS